MAKLGRQVIVIEISKAVSDSSEESIEILDGETISQIKEAVEAFVGDDSGAIVELLKG